MLNLPAASWVHQGSAAYGTLPAENYVNVLFNWTMAHLVVHAEICQSEYNELTGDASNMPKIRSHVVKFLQVCGFLRASLKCDSSHTAVSAMFHSFTSWTRTIRHAPQFHADLTLPILTKHCLWVSNLIICFYCSLFNVFFL